MQKILVANRAEIALRIMRTIKQSGRTSVAVFSEEDREAPFVKFADESYCIGPALATESYLNQEIIVQTALDAGCDGIHPGYGFLSENKDFARRVRDSGIIFIGPSPEAIDMMGNKLAAKEAVKNYDIPMLPGTTSSVNSLKEAQSFCEEYGFPMIIKAAAGGGGKGMRIVRNGQDLVKQFQLARGESMKAFGDDSVFLEKYLDSPRHIEVQVFGDNFGNYVHLFERECSIQRRHQKVIEEAPSPIVSRDLRNKMGMAAIDVARACNYSGAGTVEFLVDRNLNFYFLEMNTRLQVEHPVTEMITGIDLVKWQIDIASGMPLPKNQKELSFSGHAIELRVYAEDPFNDFAPSAGKLQRYRRPETNENIRLDDGYEEGLTVSVYYDPLISKLIVKGESRATAIQQMLHAISSYEIEGIENNLAFGIYALNHPEFKSGNIDTGFIEKYYTLENIEKFFHDYRRAAAGMALQYYLSKKKQIKAPSRKDDSWFARKSLE